MTALVALPNPLSRSRDKRNKTLTSNCTKKLCRTTATKGLRMFAHAATDGIQLVDRESWNITTIITIIPIHSNHNNHSNHSHRLAHETIIWILIRVRSFGQYPLPGLSARVLGALLRLTVVSSQGLALGDLQRQSQRNTDRFTLFHILCLSTSSPCSPAQTTPFFYNRSLSPLLPTTSDNTVSCYLVRVRRPFVCAYSFSLSPLYRIPIYCNNQTWIFLSWEFLIPQLTRLDLVRQIQSCRCIFDLVIQTTVRV